MMALLIQRTSFAQQLHNHTINNQPVSTIIRDTIDRLNDASYNIILRSPDSAHIMAEKALLLSEGIKYNAGVGRSYFNIGKAYWAQSYYPIALFYLKKALMSLPKNKPLLLADCYATTGRTYADLKNYTEAFKYIDRAEHLAGKDAGMLADAISERAYVYMRLQDYEQAAGQARRALVIDRAVKSDIDIAILYGRLSSIFYHQKEYKKALLYLDTAHRMSVATNNRRLRATLYVEYAGIYNQLHNYPLAVLYGNRGAALADSIGVVDALSGSYNALINSYRQQNNLKQAMLWQQKYNDIRDSLDAFSKAKNLQLIQNVFMLNKKLGEIDSIERNNKAIKARIHTKNTTIVMLALSLILLIILLYVTFYYYKQKELLSEQLNEQHGALLDQKKLIEAQAADLQAVSHVKDKLLAVVGHDLRTPLANISNVIRMFELEYLSAEEVHELMKNIYSSVKGADLTLTNLMEWAGSEIKGRSVNITKMDVFSLGTEMEQIFDHALRQKNIRFLNGIVPGSPVLADENHIKVVLRNLISNAIKFTAVDGHICLTADHGDHELIICVEDNGKGMTTDEISRLFHLQTHFSQQGTLGEHGTGIGLILCKELIELNSGRLWVESVSGQGSRFYFSLPLHEAYV